MPYDQDQLHGLRAASYLRISSDRNQLRLGVDDQRRQSERLCTDYGMVPLGEPYEDNDKSAAKRRAVRPEYERMVAEIRAGGVDVVVVAAVDRLQRHPGALEEFLEITDDGRRMRWLVSNREGIIDLTDPDALLRLRESVARAAWSVSRDSERQRNRQRDMADRGVSKGGGKRAFGWVRQEGVRDGTVVDEAEAALIREAAERVLAGESLRSIRDDWNRRGVPTVSGGPWRTNSVKSVLRSPRNAGLRQHGERDNIVTEADWPAIIDRETYDQLQAIFANPNRWGGGRVRTLDGMKRRSYPLRGVLTCGECGNLLSSTARKRATPADPDRRRRYYMCRKDADGCGRVMIDAEKAEGAILPMILRWVDDPQLRQLTADEHAAEAAEIRRLVAENAEDEAKIARWEGLLMDGDISPAAVRKRRKPVEEQITARRARIAELQGTSVLDRFQGRIAENWDELTADDQRIVILSLVERIDVHRMAERRGFNQFDPERLQFRWRYGVLAELASDRLQALDPDGTRPLMVDEEGHVHEIEIGSTASAALATDEEWEAATPTGIGASTRGTVTPIK